MDNSVISGLQGTLLWAALSVLFLFAYLTPELPTPSFEFHTAFTVVEMGIVPGAQQTYHYFHHGFVVCSMLLLFRTIPAFVGRMLLEMPTILIVLQQDSSKCTLPVVSNCLCIPIKSTTCSSTLNCSDTVKMSDKLQQGGYLQKLLWQCEAFDVDTGIRFLQDACLAWSVVDLVPSLF